MRDMSRNVIIYLPSGGGSGSAHHHRPWGPAPFGLLYDDHLFLRIAMLVQSLFCLADILDTLRRDRSEFVNRAQAIVSTTFTLASCTELLLVVQGAYWLSQPCLGKPIVGTRIFSINIPPCSLSHIFSPDLRSSM